MMAWQVTFIEAMPRIMFFFDKQIAQLAERLLIRPRNIDYRIGVFASKVGHAYLATFNSRAACHMPPATYHQPGSLVLAGDPRNPRR